MTSEDYDRQLRTLRDIVLYRQESATALRDRSVISGDHPMFMASIGGKAVAYREIGVLIENILQGIPLKPPDRSSVRIAAPTDRPAMARTPRGGMSSNRKLQVKRRGGFLCHYCGVQPPMLEIEHVVPRCLGGTVALSNLVPACLQCNDDKGAALWADHCEFCERAVQIWLNRHMQTLWSRWPIMKEIHARAA